MNQFEIKNLNIRYMRGNSVKPAASNVSFFVKPGECLGIIGESGSGKSSVGKAVAGLLPSTAEMSFGRKTPGKGLKTAMIFQNPMTCLNPSLTVEKQLVETICHHSGCSKKKARGDALEYLDLAGIHDPRECIKRYPFQLSGGMQQRVVIAIALACRPELLIADEPTTALDRTVQKQILDLLREIICETGISIILITHDFGTAANLCDRILVMKKGVVLEEGDVYKIFNSPEHEYTKKLIEDARSLLQKPAQIPRSKKLLEVCGIHKIFENRSLWGKNQQVRALNNLSLTVDEGESFGIIGESGSGKTTLARLVAGIESPSGGTIFYKGVPVHENKTDINSETQLIFQDNVSSFHPLFSVKQIMEEPLLYKKVMSREEIQEKIHETMNLVGLDETDIEKLPNQLSGGELQRLAIGRALIGDPRILICDEAVSALDISIQVQVLKLLKDIQLRKKLSYLFISHDLDVIRYISQRMGVVYNGTMLESGNTEEIYEEPWHPYTKQLLSVSLAADLRKKRRNHGISFRERDVNVNRGCQYYMNCSYALGLCKNESPQMYSYGSRQVSCFLYSDDLMGMRSKDYKMTSQI